MNKYINSINKAVSQADLFCSDYARAPKCCIVVVPQIQLSPYVAALIHSQLRNVFDIFIIIHPVGNPFSRLCFDHPELFITINVRDFIGHEKEGVGYLIEKLSTRELILSGVLCHPFSQGVNRYVADSLIPQNDCKVYIYSDGSRNNFSLEWSRDGESSLIDKACNLKKRPKLFSFGFLSHDFNWVAKDVDISIVAYDSLDFVFSTCHRHIEPLNVKKMDGNSIGPAGLVLSRYWGREPYVFEDECSLSECYQTTIEKAFYGSKCKTLVMRCDNRSDLPSLSSANFKFLDFLDFFECKFNASEFLMENILHFNASFLKNFRRVFVFDSSFPLVFQSLELSRLLSHELVIVVGVSRLDVIDKMSENGVNVIKNRVCALVGDLVKLKQFAVTSSIGPVTSSNPEYIERVYDNSTGYFELRLL